MEKKRKSVMRVIGFLILIILIIFLVFLLIYAFSSKKETAQGSTGGESNGSVFGEFVKGITDKIKSFGGGGGGGGSSSSGGGSSGGGGGSSGGSSSSSSGGDSSGTSGTSGGTTTLSTDKTICQNAQSNALCSGLDITYGEGYKDACCSENSLCC